MSLAFTFSFLLLIYQELNISIFLDIGILSRLDYFIALDSVMRLAGVAFSLLETKFHCCRLQHLQFILAFRRAVLDISLLRSDEIPLEPQIIAMISS